jgi:hypothetical protein
MLLPRHDEKRRKRGVGVFPANVGNKVEISLGQISPKQASFCLYRRFTTEMRGASDENDGNKPLWLPIQYLLLYRLYLLNSPDKTAETRSTLSLWF